MIRRNRRFKEDFAKARLRKAGYTGSIFYDDMAMSRARKSLNEIQRLLAIATDNQLSATEETNELCKEFEQYINDALVTIRYILDSYEQD